MPAYRRTDHHSRSCPCPRKDSNAEVGKLRDWIWGWILEQLLCRTPSKQNVRRLNISVDYLCLVGNRKCLRLTFSNIMLWSDISAFS